jgi:putative FmdB family regulatory protein
VVTAGHDCTVARAPVGGLAGLAGGGRQWGVPTYAYRCRECTEQFEVKRPISEAAQPARCPAGHTDTVKLLTTVAVTGRSGAPAPAAAGGGCCGGACCGG